jgi:hypothetical protein
MDLVRDILLATERSDRDPRGWVGLDLAPRSKVEVSYHVHLLADAGLLIGQDLSHMGPDGYEWMPKRLTWEGHEFLDNIRDPDVWRRTKEGAKEVGGFSLELLGALAKGFVKKKIEEHTGIELDL